MFHGDMSWICHGYELIIDHMGHIFSTISTTTDLCVCLKMGDPLNWLFQWGKWWLPMAFWVSLVSNNIIIIITIITIMTLTVTLQFHAIKYEYKIVQDSTSLYENQGWSAWNKSRRFPSAVWRPDLQNQEEQVKAISKGQANIWGFPTIWAKYGYPQIIHL